MRREDREMPRRRKGMLHKRYISVCMHACARPVHALLGDPDKCMDITYMQ